MSLELAGSSNDLCFGSGFGFVLPCYASLCDTHIHTHLVSSSRLVSRFDLFRCGPVRFVSLVRSIMNLSYKFSPPDRSAARKGAVISQAAVDL